MNLHIKQERKELLTEHLMTIIQESEDRKSKKLAELMNRLQIQNPNPKSKKLAELMNRIDYKSKTEIVILKNLFYMQVHFIFMI